MKNLSLKLSIIVLIVLHINTFGKVKLGNEKLINDYFHLIEGKKIGIIANHTSILYDRKQHLVDYLHETNKVEIVAVFGPEHGFRGNAPDGIKIDNTKDEKTGITIYSLYGKTNKPTPEILKDIQVLIFDIQDVGARFYTYISTLYLCLEAAAENDIEFVVCDRPNPIGGEIVDGPILKKDFQSFVGIAPLPIQHGMTIGELALYFKDLIKQKLNKEVKLTILTMDGWSRNMIFPETGLDWISPSPNIVNFWSAILYPGICLIEATNVSEGRGTSRPFQVIGAPFINSDELIRELEKLNFTSLNFSPISFTPIEIEGMAKNPKFNNQSCNGVKIQVEATQYFYPVQFGIALVSLLKKLYPKDFEINKARMNRLLGDDKITDMLERAVDYRKIVKYYEKELNQFKKLRTKYLLYK
ncbi:MAG: DUF1343 domain-containing protein [Ignavibacteria bacterium]|nr:DUF1343 domain-containing protein [Ignavibacteria bacterium]